MSELVRQKGVYIFGAVIGLAAGCTMDFAPPSLLQPTEPRVLAVEVSPLDAEPGEQVTATPRLFVPVGGAAPAPTWRFCPLSAGARASYACVVPACETRVDPQPDGSVIIDPTALALACLETLASADPGAAAGATPDMLPEVVEMILSLDLEISPGVVQTSIVRLPYYPGGAPRPRNRSPLIAGIDIGGVAASTTSAAAPLAEGAQVTWVVRTDPTSLDAYQDALDRPQTEEPIVSFYSTAGRFDSDRASGVAASNFLEASELAATDREAMTYVVVRDGRGGQAIAGPFTVPITR